MLTRIRKHLRTGTLIGALTGRLAIPFQTRPLNATNPNQSYTTSHLTKGEAYHNRFNTLPGRSLLWELEQQVLANLAKEIGPFEQYLDFAAGTGRIAALLTGHSKKQVLLDVSESMLEVAGKHLPNALLLCRDFRENAAEITDATIDLATAFRFFPNAEETLRNQAMAFLARKIKKKGWLICNNHRSFWSVPSISARLTCCGGRFGMANKDLICIAKIHGFALHRTFSMGIIPQTEARAILPWRFVEPFERGFFRLFGTSHRLGCNVIFLFERL